MFQWSKGQGARNLRVVEPEADPETQLGCSTEKENSAVHQVDNKLTFLALFCTLMLFYSNNTCLYQTLYLGYQETGASLPMNEAASSSSEDNNEDICGICIESIYEKRLPKQKTFGILPNCNHAFCELCLITWRQMDGYSSAVVK